MKGGLCIIYTSLLTISVISSCALFLLVVSEGLQVDTEADTTNKTVILDGLQNVTNKISTLSQNNVVALPKNEPQIIEKIEEKPKDSILQDNEMTFTDTLSLNSVTTDGLPDTGQPPILISLTGSAKLQLKKEDDLLYVNDSEQHNDTKTRLLVEAKNDETEKKENIGNLAEPSKETLVVQAKPMQDAKQVEEPAAPSVVAAATEDIESQQNTTQNQSTTNIPVKAETPQEDIPSFSEWAQKQLAEAEKKDTVLNHSSQPSHNNVNASNKSTKLRSKNYASPACGAKIVAVNPEAGSASSILSPNRDEYMLNTCNSRIWFVVELCEPVQAQKIEIANFELFSSIPKDFAVFFSDRFPTRDWASVGQFTAKDLRDVQSFDLFPHMFGKFIKVEMNSHYGSEHYCPISLFKVYGTSEFEVLEKENAQHVAHVEDDDEIMDVPDVPTAEAEASKNLFGSARDAVMSIMKKAAQVLVKSEVPRNASSQLNDTTENMYKHCCSPSHIIVCDNCSQSMYNEVHDLISCNANELTSLISHVFIRDTLKCTKICQPFGLDFKSTKTITFSHHRVRYMEALYTKTYLAAMCNILAIQEKKVVLNTSFETEHNATTNITLDKPFNISDNQVTEEAVRLPTNSTSDVNNNTSETTEFENNTVTKEASPETNTDLPKQNKDNAEVKKDELAPVVTEKPDEKTKVDTSLEIESAIVKETSENKDDKKVLEDKDDLKNKGVNAKEDTKSKEKNMKDAGSVPEENEQLFIDNESFLSEFDQLTADPTPPGTQTQNNQQSQTIQKESVFLRLSNRVKTLERNMSLSGQYLEELSRRYKKQVEEMQKSFEKTIQQMAEERQKSNEKEQKYAEQMTNMQEQIAQMSVAVKLLMDERDSWFGNVTFIKFIVLQTITIAAVIYYIKNRKRPEPVLIPVHKKISKNKRNQDKFRRKSVEGVSGHETPSAKKRRPSEEALQIARQSTENIDAADDDGEWQVARKNRRRKTSILHRNLDENKQTKSWCRQDSIGELQENPISLDEEEFIAPVPEPAMFSKLVPSKEPKTNGSLFNNLKSKTMKSRRLSSPAFLRTLSRQSSRSTPARNDVKLNGRTRMSSESPTSSLWSQSTEVSQINGQCDNVSVNKTKKKSFKNIFRKVF